MHRLTGKCFNRKRGKRKKGEGKGNMERMQPWKYAMWSCCKFSLADCFHHH